MQRDRGLGVIDLMGAPKSPDSNALEAGSLDHSHDGVLLLHGRDSVLVSDTKVDWRIEEVCARLQFRISVTQVVFIRAGDVNSGDATAISRQKRGNITNALPSPGKTCARHRPLL